MISASTKFVVASLAVNVRAIELSLEMPPFDTVDEVIVIVDAVPSYVQVN